MRKKRVLRTMFRESTEDFSVFLFSELPCVIRLECVHSPITLMLSLIGTPAKYLDLLSMKRTAKDCQVLTHTKPLYAPFDVGRLATTIDATSR